MEERAAQELFQSLLEIRKRYRNESVHSSPLYLFAIKGVGLIPATDADLDKPSLVSPWCAKAEDARDVLEILDRTMRHLETSEATRFGFAFAKTGLAIPIAEQRLARHREAMTSMESFRLFLDRLVEHADAVANMDV